MYHMHVDADRDGKVDDDYLGIDTWEWGVGKKGAIILCNNDDENGAKNCDNDDNVINNVPDPEDIAPLVIRRASGPDAPNSWKGYLEVSADDAQHIRIFLNRTSGAVEIIGPSAGAQYTFQNLKFDEKEFGVEAVRYPNTTVKTSKSPKGAFTGEVTVTFRIDKGPSGTQIEKAVLRVAPWIALHHLCKTTQVYVVNAWFNKDFRKNIKEHVIAAGAPAPKEVPGNIYSASNGAEDIWIQDAMEIGFSSLPKSGSLDARNLPVVLRTANDRFKLGWGTLDQYPRAELLAPGYGFTQAMPPTSGSTLDSFGNLECSPPFKHGKKNKEYMFGRIVYGRDTGDPFRNMRDDVIDFLKAQLVQEPFWIDTSWLVVGHVDEVMSFCPMKNARKGFKVLLASPKRAQDILGDLGSAGYGSATLFNKINFITGQFTESQRKNIYPLDTIDAILNNPLFMSMQTDVQAHIEDIKSKLKIDLDLEDDEFIPLPVLFIKQGGRYIAYTPGVVNMLVVTRGDQTVRLCIPKPFGPVVGGQCKFEQDIESALGPKEITGVEPKFVDDFCTYHVGAGEIHCGTNSKRAPPIDRWWWEQQV